MINAKNLSMRYGGKVLFRNVNFQLNPGRHYGLVGANGTGKSTLLKIMVGTLQPESGEILFPSNYAVGTLNQDQFKYDHVKIIDLVLMGKTALWEALQKKEALLQKESFSEEECHILEGLEKLIEKNDGYSAYSSAGKLLEGLGIRAQVHENTLSTLSGGYKLRVFLAQLLFNQPEILLLDEPTNHLDLHSIQWLEGYLKNYPGIIIVSSHDRDFLNNVCDHIMDLDRETISLYKGNFDQFLDLKKMEEEQSLQTIEKQNSKIEHLEAFIDRFRAKATKAAQAQSKMRIVEKLQDEINSAALQPTSRKYPKISFSQKRASGAIPLKIKGVDKAYSDKKVLSNVSFEVERGERVAIIGPNGIGKTTLLEIVTQSIQADKGEYEWGHGVEVSYFPQDPGKAVCKESTLLEWMSANYPSTSEIQLREVLAKVLFSGDDVHKVIGTLSGGETARLLLAKMMLLQPNVLIFDEPTNHLDMESIEALMEAIKSYAGTVIFVSHNRHFVSHIANRIIEISYSGLKNYLCSFNEYLERVNQDFLTAKGSLVAENAEQKSGRREYEEQKNQKKNQAQLEKRMVQAEEKVHKIEEKIKEIEALMAEPGFYEKNSPEKIQSIVKEKDEWEERLMKALEEWEECAGRLRE